MLIFIFFVYTTLSKQNWFLSHNSTHQHTPTTNYNTVPLSDLPLNVSGRYIINNKGTRVKLSCVNWYGSDQLDYVVGGLQWQSINSITLLFKSYGFNCVRLPFSLELIDKNPLIDNTKIKSEPSLYNSHALTVLDSVIETLSNNSIMIILDNHVSQADWCCNNFDGNGLWYTNVYSNNDWLNLWSIIVQRYKNNKYVIGVDLRNELREDKINGIPIIPTWGTGIKESDWRLAAIECGNNILNINNNLLIIVEGIQYALDLRGIKNNPITNNDMIIKNKLLYESHDYSWSQPINNYNYIEFEEYINQMWGYILDVNQSYTAPVWVGEFGECHYDNNNCLYSNWWNYIVKYLKKYDVDWGYWALDGTQSTAPGRSYGSEETFGLLNTNWDNVYSKTLLSDLQSIIKPKI